MFSDMTVRKKFSLASGALVMFTIVLGGWSIHRIAVIDRAIHAITIDSLPGLASSGMVRAKVNQTAVYALKHMAATDATAAARIENQVRDLKRQLEEELRVYETTITLAEDRAMFERMRPLVGRCFSAWEEVKKLSSNGQKEKARKFYATEMEALYNGLGDSLDELVTWNKNNGEHSARVSTEAASSSQTGIWLLLGLSVVCGVLIAWGTTRSVDRALTRTIDELSEGADQTSSAASQVSSSSQSLAQGSSEQAASLEETSASSEEINSMARKNSENSRTAADLMTQSQQKFVETNLLLDQSVSAMGEIASQSDKISKILKTIDEIAFQTNILALNAAVEAARAGEAGMGFAVVADEVRNLAQRCAQAARDTAILIEESIHKSNDGKKKVDQVAASIRAITEEVGRAKTLVDEVNLGSQEQARGMEQIGKAIHQMEQVTQKTAANAEESASAAEELNAQSQTMRHIVGQLTMLVGGVAADSQRLRKPARAPGRAVEAGAGLSALRKAVSPPKEDRREPVLSTHSRGDRDPFPLDDQFKEF
jgi:methyl-accepting chemotaxis protein/methyl-accepting chemotaxis protein-1 (serine sensor receptor)